MRSSLIAAAAIVLLVQASVPGRAQTRQRLNAVISLLEHNQPVFGIYWPSNGGGRRGGGPSTGAGQAPSTSSGQAPSTSSGQAPSTGSGQAPAPRPAVDLAKDALGFTSTDFLFSGSMEGGVDRGLPAYVEFAKALIDVSGPARIPFFGLKHPLVVKTPKISDDPTKAIDNISRELNVGASGVMFVEAESAEEVRQGLAAMRFKSKGGTRPDAVGTAPAFWGLSEQEYRQKADLWPLNPDGELINWTIIESKEGLAHAREIAAVKGIGVLWPGAGTLRGVFSSTNAAGERVVDTTAHENAIQQVLAACKEFKVPCGYPATATDIEMRMKQGFSVFVMNWGDAGFRAVEVGRKAAGRSATDR